MATAENLQLKSAILEVDKSKLDVSATKTQRLPLFKGYMFGSALLTPLGFTVPAGSFGSFPATGPIPANNAQITTPAGTFTSYLVDQQPLTQLYKLHLAIREKQLTTKSYQVKYDAARQEIVKDVKQTYYGILQTESSLQTSQASVKQYQELERVVEERLSQKAALESDSLEVKAKLAQVQYNQLKLRNQLQSRKEHLNYLMGRDITTPFQPQGVPPPSEIELDMQTAQQKALAQRPEIRQARINVEKANYGKRLAKAKYIPDIGLAVHYISPFNVHFLPKNMVSAGFEMSWEPFQWGRLKDEVNESQIQYEQTQLQAMDTQSKVLLDVDNRFRDLQQARALLKVARAAQASATEKLREITQKYAQKTVLLRDVLQQQASLASANNDYEKALLMFWNSKAELEKAVGEE
jgi:outer membrane protein TolC